MRKVILAVLALLLVGPAMADDARVDRAITATLSETIVAADTAAIRTDTTYSDWYRIPSWCGIIHFAVELAEDTAFADDSTVFLAQTSYNMSDVVSTWSLDTLLAAGAGISPLIVNRTDSIFGPYLRGMFIHWDSIAAGDGATAIVGESYDHSYELWLMMHP